MMSLAAFDVFAEHLSRALAIKYRLQIVSMTPSSIEVFADTLHHLALEVITKYEEFRTNPIGKTGVTSVKTMQKLMPSTISAMILNRKHEIHHHHHHDLYKELPLMVLNDMSTPDWDLHQRKGWNKLYLQLKPSPNRVMKPTTMKSRYCHQGDDGIVSIWTCSGAILRPGIVCSERWYAGAHTMPSKYMFVQQPTQLNQWQRQHLHVIPRDKLAALYPSLQQLQSRLDIKR